MTRRLVDLIVGLGVLVAIAPLLTAIALIVATTSKGGPFYKAIRVGQHGEEFAMWKFRTMKAGPAGPAITGSSDDRITSVGRVLRKAKLDELPQFINLVRGELTLVGPRPEAPEIVERYTVEQLEILKFKPGITGPSAIAVDGEESTFIPAGDDPVDFYVEHLLAPKVQRDLDYMKRRTVTSDLGILCATARLVLTSLGSGRARPSGSSRR